MDRLNGWKQIGPYYGYSERHIRRVHKVCPLPVERIGERGHVKLEFDKAERFRLTLEDVRFCPTSKFAIS